MDKQTSQQRLGIVGIYKPNSIPQNHKDIGFTPIGKYNDEEEYSFGDANYFLHSELGQDLYNEFETAVLDALEEDVTAGIVCIQPNARIDWEVISEELYDAKREADEVIRIDSIDDIPLDTTIGKKIATAEIKAKGFYGFTDYGERKSTNDDGKRILLIKS